MPIDGDAADDVGAENGRGNLGEEGADDGEVTANDDEFDRAGADGDDCDDFERVERVNVI